MAQFSKFNKKMWNFLTFLLNLGTDFVVTDKKSYVRLANLNGLIYFALDLFLAVLFYFVFEEVHISAGIFIASLTFLVCSIGFNFYGWTTLSRLSTVSIGSIVVTYCSFYLGSEPFIAACLLLGAIFPFVYFSTEEKKSIALCLAIPVVCYAFLISTNYNWGPNIELQNPNTLFLLRSIFFIVPFFGIVINTYVAVSERETKTKNLQESQQLLETIFHALSHDLANPLQNIYMLSNLANEKGSMTSEKIKTVFRNTEKVVRVFNNLKNIAKTSTNGKLNLQLKTYPLTEIIEEAISSVQEQATSKKIIIEYEAVNCIGNHLNIRVDRDIFVHQILTNFLTNSIKFSDTAQKIKISASYKDEENTLQLVIRDWGRGIESEKISKLFSWQSRTSSQGTHGEIGSGIGLPLALKFLKSMNGELTLTSKHHTEFSADNCGTQITIIIPVDNSVLLRNAA